MAESKGKLKSLLRVKEESEKAGLKLNIHKTKIMAFQSHYFIANRWGKRGAVAGFIFLDSKITADGNCSHEIERCLLPEEKL